MGTLAYIRNFMKDKYIASVMPTSPYGVKRVCGKIDFARSRVIVEYGPGTGVFSRYLLGRMNPGAELILIERNPNFAAILRRRIADPRVSVADGSAADVLRIVGSLGAGKADCIISGIPFSFLSPDLRRGILRDSREALVEDGVFIAYQTFYQPEEHLRVPLAQVFRMVRVEFEMKNIPPLKIYEARK